ncbi:MAG: putative zinc-binding protein [Candidatus Hydrogenedentes bacterium]|nr:putative zinc-binding protein [Candidatus Hydrogenedentota bacterium]
MDAISRKPILFACAGSSDAGRAAYDLAQELTRRGVAEMSCLAGVAAEKAAFLRKLEEREVWLIDGCPVHCGAGVFERIGRKRDRHIRLLEYGIKKGRTPAEGIDIHHLADEVLGSFQTVEVP